MMTQRSSSKKLEVMILETLEQGPAIAEVLRQRLNEANGTSYYQNYITKILSFLIQDGKVASRKMEGKSYCEYQLIDEVERAPNSRSEAPSPPEGLRIGRRLRRPATAMERAQKEKLLASCRERLADYPKTCPEGTKIRNEITAYEWELWLY